MIRVFLTGTHALRTPLSYGALAPLFEGQITQVSDPAEADLYVFAHVLDIAQAPEALVRDWRARRRPVVLLSEEPFWDTIWGRQPMTPQIRVETRFGILPVVQINHQTSEIFQFDRLPYYLLTHHRFANSYRYRFARNAARKVTDWRAEFAARPCHVSFMFERRPEPYHWVTWPEGDVIGLCSWRTGLAMACHGTAQAPVERLGQSWQGGATRFDLDNWYLDKMVRLDGRARLIGAVENTHQPQYVTEKLFDAFACGAMPLYYASPGHWVHDLGLPPESWVNLFGLSPEDAAAQVMQMRFDDTRLTAFATAQRHLNTLFGDIALWQTERQRLARAVRDALQQALDQTGEV